MHPYRGKGPFPSPSFLQAHIPRRISETDPPGQEIKGLSSQTSQDQIKNQIKSQRSQTKPGIMKGGPGHGEGVELHQLCCPSRTFLQTKPKCCIIVQNKRTPKSDKTPLPSLPALPAVSARKEPLLWVSKTKTEFKCQTE